METERDHLWLKCEKKPIASEWLKFLQIRDADERTGSDHVR
jgi:hypothetical protein